MALGGIAQQEITVAKACGDVGLKLDVLAGSGIQGKAQG